MEKLYLSAPSCVQDNVDFSGFLPLGAAVSDPENQPRFQQVVTAKYCHEQHFSSRPGAEPGLPLPAEPDRGCTLHLARGDLAVAPPLTPAPKASAGSLGNNTKSSPPPPVGGDKGRRRVRAERYELLSYARKLLISEGRAAGLVYAQDYSRTAKCMYTPRDGGVGVMRDVEHKTAFYAGLVVCGSVWACPVCAAKVQERRREEIAQAFEWAYSNELQPAMVTFTFPHRAWHKLEDLVLQQREALAMLRKGKAWGQLMEGICYSGMIRALEITHGANGWHPHTHEIWFVHRDVDASKFKKNVVRRWASACARAGLLDTKNFKQMRAFARHAVHVKGDCTSSDYLAKADDSRHWGADREMAKGATKAGKLKGQHPFGLLAQAAEGDRRAGELYIEFVDTMRVTRSRQLFWSPGLKAKVGIKELDDQTIAEQKRVPADALGVLRQEEWNAIRVAGWRAKLLDQAEIAGWPGVVSLLKKLRSLVQKRPTTYAIQLVAAPLDPGE